VLPPWRPQSAARRRERRGLLAHQPAITRPLATLSVAAEALARADASLPVDDRGGDEIGQLAKAFTYMRDEIGATHTELEAQIEEAPMRHGGARTG
jgi:nitrate/nitrite-specific signal transduction histidine kinase